MVLIVELLFFSEDTVAKMQVYFKELMYERMEEQKAYEVLILQYQEHW